MAQYWNFKKENNDKILMFKLGRFYEMFYTDAIACHLVLDLNWMGGKHKVHVGFPESQISKVCNKLVNSGFHVAVVDQTETTMMAEERLNINRQQNTHFMPSQSNSG